MLQEGNVAKKNKRFRDHPGNACVAMQKRADSAWALGTLCRPRANSERMHFPGLFQIDATSLSANVVKSASGQYQSEAVVRTKMKESQW